MAVYSESVKLPVVGGPFARPTEPSPLRRLVRLCNNCFSGDHLVLVGGFTFVFAFFAGLVHWVGVFIIILVVTVVCIVVAVMVVGVVVWVVCMGAVVFAVVAIVKVTV